MAISTVGPTGLSSAVGQLGKNLVTNGGANVSQRGTQTGQYNAYTAVDQFWFQEAGSVQARFTTTQDGSGGGGHANSLKLDCTTAESTVAAGDLLNLQHRIEAQHLQHLQWGTASAKDVTLSFWMSSPKTGTHCVSLYQADATRSYIAEFTIAVVNTFEYFSVTIPGDTGGTINDDTGPGLYVSFPLLSGGNWQAAAGSWLASQDYTTSNQQNLADNTSNNIFVTGVQLEVGSVATDFEHEDIGTTLAKCQRYQRIFSQHPSLNVVIASGWGYNTTRHMGDHLFLDSPMRDTPAVTVVGTAADIKLWDGGQPYTTTGVPSIQQSSPHGIGILWDAASGTPFTAGSGGNIYILSGSNSTRIIFDANL